MANPNPVARLSGQHTPSASNIASPLTESADQEIVSQTEQRSSNDTEPSQSEQQLDMPAPLTGTRQHAQTHFEHIRAS